MEFDYTNTSSMPIIYHSKNYIEPDKHIIYNNVWEMFNQVIQLNNHNIPRPTSPLSSSIVNIDDYY